jgi:hypothetical protein
MINQLKKYGLLALLVICIYSTDSCLKAKKRLRDSVAESKAMQLQLVTVTKNKYDQLVYEAEAYKVAQKEMLKKYSDSLFSLKAAYAKKIKAVNALASIQQGVIVKNVKLKYDTVFLPTDRTSDTCYSLNDVLLPPIPFNYQDSLLQVAGVIEKSGITIDSLKLANTLRIRLVEKKASLFNTAYSLQAINTSPYFKLTAANFMFYEKNANKWNRIYKPILVAAAASFITYKIAKL